MNTMQLIQCRKCRNDYSCENNDSESDSSELHALLSIFINFSTAWFALYLFWSGQEIAPVDV